MSLPDGPAPPRDPASSKAWSDTSPTIATAAPGVLPARAINERCDHCSAPVEPAQRYCVQCGAHQRRSDDPTARWFASARRAKAAQLPAGAPPAQSGTGRTVSAGVAAVLIALLPVAAGVGVLVGRGSDDSGQAVVEALKAAGAGGGFGAGAAAVSATTPDDSAAAADGAADPSKDDKTSKKVNGVEVADEQAPILASGPAGSARKLTGTKPTTKDLKESKQALEQIESKKGEDYVEQQKDLPDTIVIP